MPSSVDLRRSAPLAGVDRAAFLVALTERLRAHGVRVDLDAAGTLARALAASPPHAVESLYWTARVCLVRRYGDLARFDDVFASVFRGVFLGEETAPPEPLLRAKGEEAPEPGPGPEQEGSVDSGVPWVTLAPDTADSDRDPPPTTLPDLLPSALEVLARSPFEQLSAEETDQLGAWLAQLRPRLPRRRTRRHVLGRGGHRVALRATLARARRTGWEPLELVRSRPSSRPRRVVLLCDVSGSMRAQAAAYVHLMRAFALSVDTEAFAFGVRLTRLTPLLREGTAEEVVARATDAVDDRFGGTRIATSVLELLSSRHGSAVRGAVVVVASDGWDRDPPEAMTAAMERLRRRAYRVVWANPRAAAAGFEPTVGGMAAALPFCDTLLPADSFAALRRVVESVAELRGTGPAARKALGTRKATAARTAPKARTAAVRKRSSAGSTG